MGFSHHIDIIALEQVMVIIVAIAMEQLHSHFPGLGVNIADRLDLSVLEQVQRVCMHHEDGAAPNDPDPEFFHVFFLSWMVLHRNRVYNLLTRVS